jgi:hypothetical protein
MFDFWKEELSEQEEEELLDKAASEIRKRKLEAPAILMLELHKPVAYVGSHAAIAFSPFLVPFLGYDNINNYSRLFSKKENIERLLQRLDRQPDEHAKTREN